ncbi:MAG TPA: protein kinase, partial [Polyangiaceae bacterium]
GGMGEVYEGIQEDLGRKVAIKVMSGPMANDPQLLARFQLEAKAVAALGHPHIVAVTDFQDNQGEPPFIVMERLVGESLGELLEREPMVDATRAVRIAEQTLSALAAAHEAGLVHRDVKPDNIFLCRTDTNAEIVKLLDFGVAKAMEAQPHGKLTSTGAIVGTLVYMAPEQARGEPIDARADVYALGACLYHMLAGQPPFPAVNAARLLSAVCNESPTPLGAMRPDLDGGIVGIVARAMARDANHRFMSARAMMGAIGAYLRGEAPLTDPMSAMSATALAPSGLGMTGAPAPFSGAPSTGPRHTPQPHLVSGAPHPIMPYATPNPPMSPYAHPGSGGGVVVPPYAPAASMPPPRRSGAIVVLVTMMMLLAGVAVAGAGWMYVRSKTPTPAAQSTSAPPPVELVAATAQGNPADPITSLAPSATASTTSQHFSVPTGTNAINTPPIPTVTSTSTVSGGASYAQAAAQMSKSFQAGDGKGCLDAYDKMKGFSEFDAGTWSMMRGYCLMEAGRCSEGRQSVRDYYAKPNPNPMLAMSQTQVDQTVSSLAQMYCPPSQLAPPERAQRAQTLLYKAQSSHDTAGAARYADEIASQLPSLPRGTDDDRHKIVGFEYAIGKAYGDAGRCNEARSHFRAQCALNSSANADTCANTMLNQTSCKSTP